MKTHGYYLVPNYLTKQQCAAVLDYALKTPSYPRPTDKDAVAQRVLSPMKFQEPYLSARYDFSPDLNVLFGCDVLQNLICDEELHRVAERYLGVPGLLDPVDLWWFVPHGVRDAAWAENYHFDFDSLKWLKFFFNFEDITIENGPHCYIAKSHQPGGLSPKIRKKGYSRLTDDNVLSIYPEEAEKIFTVPAGSLLIEDTSGLHKGLIPHKGRRLLFQYQLSNVLFLSNDILERRVKPEFEMTEKFSRFKSENSDFFRRYFK